MSRSSSTRRTWGGSGHGARDPTAPPPRLHPGQGMSTDRDRQCPRGFFMRRGCGTNRFMTIATTTRPAAKLPRTAGATSGTRATHVRAPAATSPGRPPRRARRSLQPHGAAGAERRGAARRCSAPGPVGSGPRVLAVAGAGRPSAGVGVYEPTRQPGDRAGGRGANHRPANDGRWWPGATARCWRGRATARRAGGPAGGARTLPDFLEGGLASADASLPLRIVAA